MSPAVTNPAGEPEDVITEADARLLVEARFGDAIAELDRYAEILRTRGIEWGLLGPREGDKIWSRHISNSLALSDVIPTGVEVLDVGSGAGLPGIPLAIARPDLRVTLLEPLLRRSNFLNESVDELGLAPRITVQRGRAEDYDAKFDVVTCRAVAPLGRLLKWTSHLFLPQGQLLALKGLTAEREIAESRRQLDRAGLSSEILELAHDPEAPGTRAIRIKREPK